MGRVEITANDPVARFQQMTSIKGPIAPNPITPIFGSCMLLLFVTAPFVRPAGRPRDLT